MFTLDTDSAIPPPTGTNEPFFVSTKNYTNFPCAHRQWRHAGNCSLVHGYSRSFYFAFGSAQRNACGFVVDFGDLHWLKDYLEQWFDHTLLLNPDDPLLPEFKEIENLGGATLRLMPLGCGMEGTAQQVCEYADAELRHRTKGRCWVVGVEVRENDKNSAVYLNPGAGFKGWT